MNPVLAVLLVVVVTALVTVATRHRKVSMVAVTPIYGFLAVGGIVGVAVYSHIQDQRAYDSCVDRVSRSDDNRGQHETNADTDENLLTVILPEIFDFGPETRAKLEEAARRQRAETEAGPLLSSEPLTLETCLDPDPTPDTTGTP